MSELNKEKTQSVITVTNVLKFLWLRKKFIGIIVSITMVVVLIYSFMAPFQYSSEASILPPEDSGNMGSLTSFLQTLSGGISFGAAGAPSKLLIYQEILKSRELGKMVADELDLAKKLKVEKENLEDLYYAVLHMMDAELQRSGIIRITSFTSTKYFPSSMDKDEAAKLSADILNSAIGSLDKINREKNTSKAKRKRIYIERMLSHKNAELDSLDQVIEKYRQDNKLFSLDDQSAAILNNAVTVGGELAKAELELSLKKLDYDPNSPIVKSASEKLKSLTQQYNRIQTGGLSADDQFSIPLNKVPKLMKEYANLIRDQKILEQVKLFLETQKYQESIQEESDVPTVEVLDSAQIPKIRISPNRKIMLVLAFFLSLTGASLFLIIRGVVKQNLIKKESIADRSTD
jgi:uncharacterized protein involved in exopolysaccharide biosynthesis